MEQKFNQAPELKVQKWLNTDEALSLEVLRGKVIMIFAFQMLCPGCVEHSLPQARLVHSTFSPADLVVVGLHTVFEHHEVMGEQALRAFVHEYRIEFPVAIDCPSQEEHQPLPETMRLYQMAGTPTLLLIDRQGRLRKQKMGHEHDLVLGAELMALIREDGPFEDSFNEQEVIGKVCIP